MQASDQAPGGHQADLLSRLRPVSSCRDGSAPGDRVPPPARPDRRGLPRFAGRPDRGDRRRPCGRPTWSGAGGLAPRACPARRPQRGHVSCIDPLAVGLLEHQACHPVRCRRREVGSVDESGHGRGACGIQRLPVRRTCRAPSLAARSGHGRSVHLEQRVLDELEPLAVGPAEVERRSAEVGGGDAGRVELGPQMLPPLLGDRDGDVVQTTEDLVVRRPGRDRGSRRRRGGSRCRRRRRSGSIPGSRGSRTARSAGIRARPDRSRWSARRHPTGVRNGAGRGPTRPVAVLGRAEVTLDAAGPTLRCDRRRPRARSWPFLQADDYNPGRYGRTGGLARGAECRPRSGMAPGSLRTSDGPWRTSAGGGGRLAAWRRRAPHGTELRGRVGRRPRRAGRSGRVPLLCRSGHREAVAAFGDLSSVAIPMFGGVDPGEIDESDAVRAVATRRLAGMGVDTDGGSRLAGQLQLRLGVRLRRRRSAARRPRGPGDPRRGGLPRSGAGRRAVSGHVPGQPDQQGPRTGLARPPRLQPLAGRVLCRRARPAGRLHPHRLPRHGPGRGGDRLGRSARHLRRGDASGHVDQVGPPGLCRRVLRAVLECLRGARLRGQPPHRCLRDAPPTPSSSTTTSTAASSGSTRCSSSPGARSGS